MADTRTVLQQGIELWNAHDRQGWVGLFDDDADPKAPGGIEVRGRSGAELFYDTWHEAFPDNSIADAVVFGAGDRALRRRSSRGPTPECCVPRMVTSRLPAGTSRPATRPCATCRRARSRRSTCTSMSPSFWRSWG